MFRQGLNQYFVVAFEDLPQAGNILRQIVFLDKSSRPNLRQHLFLTQSPAVVLDEQQQGLKFIRRQMNWLAIDQESFLLRIEKKLSELVDESLICGYFLHGRNNSEQSQKNSKTLLGIP